MNDSANGSLADGDRITQICFVTDDLDASITWFTDLTGKAPKFVGGSPGRPEDQTVYQGKQVQISFRQALFAFANLDVEFIEPGPEPSTWRAFLEQKGPGCHHIAFNTRDMKSSDAYLDARGHGQVQRGEFKNGRYAYFDLEKPLGVQLELLEFDRDKA